MNFTPEMLAKSQATRKARVAAGAEFRRDWLDAGVWEDLAQKHRIRLPAWWVAPTPAALRRWHKRLAIQPFSTVYGCSPSKLIALNPKTPLRAFVGQMLETYPHA